MCLGVPGKILEMWDDSTGMKMGRVSFGGIVKEVCLWTTPEAEVGQYVIVHVGFALSVIDEEEAERVFGYLEEMAELGELEVPEEGRAASA
jgi:hydrogenase expression/formation protein HypC